MFEPTIPFSIWRRLSRVTVGKRRLIANAAISKRRA
jgi:hypothetical protein